MLGVKTFWRVASLTPEDLHETPFQSSNRDLITDEVAYVRLVRPSYQRSLVWKRERARQFMVSLSRGYPFGVLVLAHDGVAPSYNGMNVPHHVYRMIDGQQRIYWLNRMREDFFTDGWFVESTTDHGFLTQMTRLLLESLGESAESRDDKQVLSLLKSVMTVAEAATNPYQFLQHFIRESGVLPPVQEAAIAAANDAATRLWEELREAERKFKRLPVPVLIIGQQLASELPDVFVKLNSGVRLSRFDIFAAQWAMVTLDLDVAVRHPNSGIDASLASHLVRFSQGRLEDGDVADSDYEVELGTNESVINLYEYLYSLSRYIADRYPLTIGSVGKAAEELVLNVAAVLFVGDIGRMDALGDRYPKGSEGTLDFETFPTAVLQAADAVDDALKPLLSWDLGTTPSSHNPTKRRSIPSALGLLQLTAYMGAYIANVYEVRERSIQLAPAGSGAAGTVSRFKKSLRTWYLQDAVTSPFKGSEANTNVAERVWAQFPPRVANRDMTGPVPLDRLSESVRRYVEDSLRVDVTPARRDLNQPGAGAILRCVYSHQTPHSGEDRDHVVPVAAFRGLVKAPGNHVANWMPLNVSDNRRRGAQMWADCWPDSQFDSHRVEIERHLFVDPMTIDSTIVRDTETFVEFLRTRYNAMVDSMAKAIAHPDEPDHSRVVAHLQLDHPSTP